MNQASQRQWASRHDENRRAPARMSGTGPSGRGRLIPASRGRQPSSMALLLTVFDALLAFWKRRSARAAALGAGVLSTVALMVAPATAANVDLAAGMPINVGNHGCSLGFFGFNARGDRLAVTADHCSDAVPDEPVYANNGVQLGQVVAWKEDTENAAGKLDGTRGYTVFRVYKRFSLEPFFAGVDHSISDGDRVTKFGQRSGKTNGVVNSIRYDPKQPDLALTSSNMVQLPGDSGCPWYTGGDMLVGMGSSGDQEWAGGDAGSQAQPVQAVVDLIRANGSVWTDHFNVWTQ